MVRAAILHGQRVVVAEWRKCPSCLCVLMKDLCAFFCVFYCYLCIHETWRWKRLVSLSRLLHDVGGSVPGAWLSMFGSTRPSKNPARNNNSEQTLSVNSNEWLSPALGCELISSEYIGSLCGVLIFQSTNILILNMSYGWLQRGLVWYLLDGVHAHGSILLKLTDASEGGVHASRVAQARRIFGASWGSHVLGSLRTFATSAN